MNSHIVVTGDTFETIARKVYGTEVNAFRIINANPGTFEPLVVGSSIVVPGVPTAPRNQPSNTQDEVALNIDNKLLRFWTTIKIKRALDSMDSVEFTAPFDPDEPNHREVFKPLSFKDISVAIGGEPLFRGTMLNPIPFLDSEKNVITVNGYALPGVLNDCGLPASAFPLQFDGARLGDIAKTVADYFGIEVEFIGDQGPVFDRVAAEPTKKAYQFLTELAQQRGFIISSTPLGKLLFQKSVTGGKPVARLQQGSPPLMGVTPQFDAQQYYSHITGLQPTVLGLPGSQFTGTNSRLQGVIRPLTFEANDTTAGSIKEAVLAKAGRMFANVVSYLANVATWRDSAGLLWTPNTIITLLSPENMIYTESKFIIRSVEFTKTENSKIAVLNLVLPGVFSGKIPEVLPWEE